MCADHEAVRVSRRRTDSLKALTATWSPGQPSAVVLDGSHIPLRSWGLDWQSGSRIEELFVILGVFLALVPHGVSSCTPRGGADRRME